MNEDYRSNSPSSSLFVPATDDHYNNEHATQRPRLSPHFTPLALPRVRSNRYPGDGLDYRRPIMSSSASAPSRDEDTGVIDLTHVDSTLHSPESARVPRPEATNSSASRATRFPRFGRDIIDVDGESEENDQAFTAGLHLPDTSPFTGQNQSSLPESSSHNSNSRQAVTDMDDIEIVGERPTSRPPGTHRSDTPATPRLRNVTSNPDIPQFIDLTNEEDDLVHVATRVREGVNLGHPVGTAGVGIQPEQPPAGTFLGMGIPNRLYQRLRALPVPFGTALARTTGRGGHDYIRRPNHYEGLPGRAQLPPYHARAHRDAHHAHAQAILGTINMGMNIGLDYETVGFDLGYPGATRPAPEKYIPPPSPESGFTRSPGEGDVVVCPNCGDELAMGDNELKQEIWVIKQCGHAYCGECTHNRSRGGRSTKKGKGKAVDDAATPPFRNCVVHGCGKPAGHKSMVHVFLGS